MKLSNYKTSTGFFASVLLSLLPILLLGSISSASAKFEATADTTISVKSDGEILPPKEDNSQIKLGNISTKTTIAYFAFGTSLSAGYRNGGLYREAQLTSFPNLLAIQMNALNFKMPLFKSEEGNGTGFIVKDKNGQPKRVANNLAVRSQSELVRYTKADLNYNCVAVPGLRLFQSFFGGKYGFGNPNGLGAVYNPLMERLLPEGEEDRPFASMLYLAKEVDFFTLELGYEDVLGALNSGGFDLLTRFTEHEGLPYETFMKFFKNKKAQGIVMNVPDLTQNPNFQINGNGLLSKIFITCYDGKVREIKPGEIIAPVLVDSIMSKKGFSRGFSSNNPLRVNDVVDEEELKIIREQISAINTQLSDLTAKYGFTLFDLNNFYVNISKGKYEDHISKKMISIDSYSLFSSDKISFSTLTQVALANKIAQHLNENYNASIPLIDVNKIVK